jgi:hypothetical protein
MDDCVLCAIGSGAVDSDLVAHASDPAVAEVPPNERLAQTAVLRGLLT